MLVLDLCCGLGNQMFQYAFGRSVQEKFKEEKLYLNLNIFNRIDDGRAYSLNNFKLSDSVVIPKKSTQMYYDFTSKVKRRILCLNKISTSLFGKENYLYMSKHGLITSIDIYKYLGIPEKNKRVNIINGFWQSPKYFNDIGEKIRDELIVTTPPSEENKGMMHKIESVNSVCVHIRRGDYINTRYSKELNICDYDYYSKAMEVIAERTENPVFFIFSNSSEDLEWIRENYKFDYNVVYVDLNNPDYEELRLMYSCKHLIISNSTFSWWAQFLCRNSDKIIVAPKVWNINPLEIADDIYMDSWITV